MIQREVANRFKAKPNTKEYNSLSVFLQYNFDIEKVCDVSKNCFEPIPKVDSMVIKLKTKQSKIKVDNEKIFYRDFPTELEALADNEFIYNLLIETYNQAFFTGYKAGVTDLERLINMCDE